SITVVHTTEVIYLWVAAVSGCDTPQVDHSPRPKSLSVTLAPIDQILNDAPGGECNVAVLVDPCHVCAGGCVHGGRARCRGPERTVGPDPQRPAVGDRTAPASPARSRPSGAGAGPVRGLPAGGPREVPAMTEGPSKSGKWLHQAMAAVVTLLVIAAGTRLAADLLAPLVPLLVIGLALYALYAFVFGRFRK